MRRRRSLGTSLADLWVSETSPRSERRGREEGAWKCSGLSVSRARHLSPDLLRLARSVAAAHLGARDCCGRGCWLPRPPWAAACGVLRVPNLPSLRAALCPLVPDRLVLCPLGRCALVGLACAATAAAVAAGERVSERKGRARVLVSHRYLER